MNWNIAQAKQHFSDVVKQAATEPQIIYNRNTPVAVMIAAEDLAEYKTWKEQQRPQTLADSFAELRQLMIDAGFVDGLELPSRSSISRPNAFVQMLEEEYPETQA
jgi:prevent-host-death family protein